MTAVHDDLAHEYGPKDFTPAKDKYIYVLDGHATYFYGSEYGCVWTVVASSDEECLSLIINNEREPHPWGYLGTTEEISLRLKPLISESKKFKLSSAEEESRVVSEFIT